MGGVYSAIYPSPSVLSLITSQRTAHPVALINRDILLRCNGYDSADYPAEDLALWLRMSRYGSIISVPAVLLRYRISSGSISSQNRILQIDKKVEFIDKFKLWDEWLKKCINEFDQTLNSYANLPHSSERIFLHIRDIILVGRRIGKPTLVTPLLMKLGIWISIKVFSAALCIFVMTIFRRIYRFRKGYF